MLLGATYQFVDVWGCRRWATPFVWLGANAITLYFIDDVLGFIMLGFSDMPGFERFAMRFVGGDFAALLDGVATPGAGHFIVRASGLALAIALAGFSYRRQDFPARVSRCGRRECRCRAFRSDHPTPRFSGQTAPRS